MKLCKDCIYFDKLRSRIESKQLGKKVIFCMYQNKTIEKKQANKMTKCDLFTSSKPE